MTKRNVSDLTKAGSFASKLIKDGVPGGIACHAAASYYKEDASDVGRELNRRKKFRKQRPIDDSPIGQQAVAQNTKQLVSQNVLNEKMHQYGCFVTVSNSMFNHGDNIFFHAVSQEGQIFCGRFKQSDGGKLLSFPFQPDVITIFNDNGVVFKRYAALNT